MRFSGRAAAGGAGGAGLFGGREVPRGGDGAVFGFGADGVPVSELLCAAGGVRKACEV